MTLTTAAKISAAYMLAVVLAGMTSDFIAGPSVATKAGFSPDIEMAASFN